MWVRCQGFTDFMTGGLADGVRRGLPVTVAIAPGRLVSHIEAHACSPIGDHVDFGELHPTTWVICGKAAWRSGNWVCCSGRC